MEIRASFPDLAFGSQLEPQLVLPPRWLRLFPVFSVIDADRGPFCFICIVIPDSVLALPSLGKVAPPVVVNLVLRVCDHQLSVGLRRLRLHVPIQRPHLDAVADLSPEPVRIVASRLEEAHHRLGDQGIGYVISHNTDHAPVRSAVRVAQLLQAAIVSKN
eukprot:1137848-Rhodomonas_salina.1